MSKGELFGYGELINELFSDESQGRNSNIFAHGTSDRHSLMEFAVGKADEDENLLLEKQDYFEAEVYGQHGWNLKPWKAG